MLAKTSSAPLQTSSTRSCSHSNSFKTTLWLFLRHQRTWLQFKLCKESWMSLECFPQKTTSSISWQTFACSPTRFYQWPTIYQTKSRWRLWYRHCVQRFVTTCCPFCMRWACKASSKRCKIFILQNCCSSFNSSNCSQRSHKSTQCWLSNIACRAGF